MKLADMNIQPLTAERLRQLMHYDPKTGMFTNLVYRGSRAQVGTVARGCQDKDGYLMIKIDYRMHRMHRLAWLYMTGVMPYDEIDHRNTVVDDNRWDNLRDATRRINGENIREAHVDNPTGTLGVSFDKTRNKYRSGICIHGKRIHLGRYKTVEEAHQVYLAAKRSHHEGNTL